MQILISSNLGVALATIAEIQSISIFDALKTSTVTGFEMVHIGVQEDIDQALAGGLFDEATTNYIFVANTKFVLNPQTLSTEGHYLILDSELYSLSDIPKPLQKSILKQAKYSATVAKKELETYGATSAEIKLLLTTENYFEQLIAYAASKLTDNSVEYLKAIQPESLAPIFWLGISEDNPLSSARQWFTRFNDLEAQMHIALLLTKSYKLSKNLQHKVIANLIQADSSIKSGNKLSPTNALKLALYQSLLV